MQHLIARSLVLLSVLLLSFLSSSGLCAPIDLSERLERVLQNGGRPRALSNFGANESALKKSIEFGSPANEVYDLAEDLALRYLSEGRIQEAIWAADRGGLYSQAEAMAFRIERHLSNHPDLQVIGPIGKGVTQAKLGKVGQIDVLIKPRDPGSPNSIENEVFAYRLDRMLGFNLVPIAVVRKIDGVDHSLHYFVHGAAKSGISFRDRGYPKYFSDLYVFDYLTDQKDRHAENSLFTASWHLFAIDQGRMGDGFGDRPKFSTFDPHLVPSRNLLSHLTRVSIDEVSIQLSKMKSSRSLVTLILDRLRIVQSELPRPMFRSLDFAIPERPIDADLRLRPLIVRAQEDRIRRGHTRSLTQQASFRTKITGSEATCVFLFSELPNQAF